MSQMNKRSHSVLLKLLINGLHDFKLLFSLTNGETNLWYSRMFRRYQIYMTKVFLGPLFWGVNMSAVSKKTKNKIKSYSNLFFRLGRLTSRRSSALHLHLLRISNKRKQLWWRHGVGVTSESIAFLAVFGARRLAKRGQMASCLFWKCVC